MSWIGEWKRRVGMLLHRSKFRRDLEDEMRLHLELRREKHIAAGLDANAARQAALRRFGNTTRLSEKSTMAWGWSWLETFLQDVGFGIRAMLRTPAITIVALISLALGIGANTSIFSFLDAIMLRSLPVKNPQQLVKLGKGNMAGITDTFAATQLYSYPFYRRFAQRNDVFSETAAVFSMENHPHGYVDNGNDPEPISVQTVSGTYFETLGVNAELGRVIDENDDSSEGEHPVLVISNGFWKRRFGADPGVLHHTVTLGNAVFSIVGVAPPEFFGTTVGQAPDAWAPLSMAGVIPPNWGAYKDNFSESLYIIARLKPGVSIEQATAETNVLFRQILLGFPNAKLTQKNLENLHRSHVQLVSMERGLSALRREYSQPLMILMGIVGLVLLIACANIANLLLARSTARDRELAVRQALGAGRWRIVRQLLTESLVLALAGGALGVGFALSADRLLLRMISNGQNTIPIDVSLSAQLLVFTLVVTVATALLFGTLPALRATRLQLNACLKTGSGSSSTGGRTPLAKALVVSQVALSLVLMTGACLFLRTLVNLSRVDTGFNRENVLRLNIDSDVTGYKGDDPRMTLLFQQIEDRVHALPGVKAASFSAFTFGEGSWNTKIVVPGMPFNYNANVMHNIIGNGFFKVMQIPLIAGREFGPQDTASSSPVAIISEGMAKALFPDGPVIGRTYSIGDPNTIGNDSLKDRTVIGIAKDVKTGDLGGPPDYVDYLPYTQREWGFGDFEVRYIGEFGSIAREVQNAIHSVDRRLPIMNVETLSQQVAGSYSDQTIIAELSGFFALVAVFLSCIGLYGLMSYLVSRRTGEIGIRMALGARRAEVGWRVMREIALLILFGIILGLPVTMEGAQLVEKMLYGLKGTDPVSLSAAVLVLVFAGLLAGYLPARRASRVDPLTALRYE
jgi:predicted permease